MRQERRPDKPMPLMDKIQDKTAIIGVVGLGYVGLPLAIVFAEAGFRVIGIDTNQDKLDTIYKGVSYIADVDSSRAEAVVQQGRLRPLNWEQVDRADIFIMCVPTPITEDKKPDLRYIAKYRLSNRDSMMILESSTYPGTTRDVVIPILDGLAKYVAYSPERVDPGSEEFNIRNTPKLVGGINKKSTTLATELYRYIVDNVVPVSSPEVAETAKLFENVFRNVNIALVNELALICEKIGVSVWEVIDAASTKPFGFMPFYPGVGVGGHCVPVDPYYLVDKADEHSIGYTKLMHKALDVNEEMPLQVARWVSNIIVRKYGSMLRVKILILGVAFKLDVADTRESPAIELLEILQSWGAEVCYSDPYVHRITNHKTYDETSVGLTNELLESVDCTVIATDHSCYNWKWIVDKAKLVFDTRNATKGIVSDKIYRLGERKTE